MFKTVFRSNRLFAFSEITKNSIRKFNSNTKLDDLQVNNVELIGTIYQVLFTKPWGYKACLVKTMEAENKFYYHMVGTMKEQCPVGQRVHILGRASSKNEWSEMNKLRQKVIIKASEFNLLGSSNEQKDKNHIELYSQIFSHIENFADFSTFTMTTRHIRKGGAGAGIYIAENHRIHVRDPTLLEITRNDLHRLDWVRIEGKIAYSYSRNSKDQLRTSGFILAHNLSKDTPKNG